MNAAMRSTDAVITAYRAHGWTYIRGISPVGVLAELTGVNADHQMSLVCKCCILHRLKADFILWQIQMVCSVQPISISTSFTFDAVQGSDAFNDVLLL